MRERERERERERKRIVVYTLYIVQDFSVPWFLPFCFGDAPPEDSLVCKYRTITDTNVNELIRDHDVPFLKLKPYIGHVNDNMKGKIAQREEKLDTILW